MISLTQKWDESRFIACLLVGGSSKDASQRCIGYPLRTKGWAGFIRENVLPGINLGFTRFSLHNPAGTLPTEPMQADQFIHALESGHQYLVQDFVSEWSKITSMGIEVNCYMGQLKDDPNFKALQNVKNISKWLQRIWNSYRFPLEAGMNISFDTLFDVSQDSPELKFYELLTALGVRTYVEPLPIKTNPWLARANFIITEQLYGNKDSTWETPDKLLTGEKIRLLNQPYGNKTVNTFQNEIEWLPQWMKSCKDTNYSCMFGPYCMYQANVTVSEMLKRTNAVK